MEIGNQIKALRLHRGTTQEALAQHLGVTAQAVSKWERGVATPDIGMLPDISAYIASLDLSQIAPQNTDTEGKVLIYNSAAGWYEKTENEIYAIVRIAWRYFQEGDVYTQYYDETFILLDKTGDHIISREELIELIGENRNISHEEYGVAISMPM